MEDEAALRGRIETLERRLTDALRANRDAQLTILEQNQQLDRVRSYFDSLTYKGDGFSTEGKNTDFLKSPRFQAAYQRGMASGHTIRRTSEGTTDLDLHIEWRVAIACWAGWHAARLPGDFVECGTYTGILSLAVCEYIDFNATGKSFYLFDTFEGIPSDQISESEGRDQKLTMNEHWYPDFYETTLRNFVPFPRAQLIRGRVPETLSAVEIERVCYLSIDMNIAYPERAALEFFWPKLVAGGIVVFDDYAFPGHAAQKQTADEFAAIQGVEIFTLPTGQGLLIKS